MIRLISRLLVGPTISEHTPLSRHGRERIAAMSSFRFSALNVVGFR